MAALPASALSAGIRQATVVFILALTVFLIHFFYFNGALNLAGLNDKPNFAMPSIENLTMPSIDNLTSDSDAMHAHGQNNEGPYSNHTAEVEVKAAILAGGSDGDENEESLEAVEAPSAGSEDLREGQMNGTRETAEATEGEGGEQTGGEGGNSTRSGGGESGVSEQESSSDVPLIADEQLIPDHRLMEGAGSLVLLHGGPSQGARCLDGSPPAFYFRRHPEKDNATWQLHFFGGAWCSGPNLCHERSKIKMLGSSNNLSKAWDVKGLSSQNKSVSEGVGNANIVLLVYCDGGSFSGQRSEPLEVKGSKLYLQGRSIVRYALQRLLDSYGMGQAKRVLFSGCSAGGLGVLLNCDLMRDIVSSHLQRRQLSPKPDVRCLTDAAIFPDVLDIQGSATMRTVFSNVFSLHELGKSVPSQCLAERPESDAYQCLFAEHLLKYVQSPIFVVNSIYDAYNLFQFSATNEDMKRCLQNREACTADQSEMIEEIGNKVSVAAESVLSNALNNTNGIFLYSCFQHCASEENNLWRQTSINGTSLASAVRNWWEGSRVNIYKDCPYPCQSCPI